MVTFISASSNDRHQENSASIPGRVASALENRRWGTFVIELLLIVVGIVVALSIDDWVQDRADRRSEEAYLKLLVRDLDQTIESLHVYVEFETAMATAGATALETLAVDGFESKGEALREHLSNLGSRSTLRLVNAAYTDLISTGNLQLIRSRDLRDQLLQYFAKVSRTELVIEKNNTVFIDNIFWKFTIDSGITWTPSNWREMDDVLNKAEDYYQEFNDAGVAYPTDVALTQPVDAEIWNDIRRMCFLRLRVSAVGLSLATELIDKTEQMKSAISEELRSLNT